MSMTRRAMSARPTWEQFARKSLRSVSVPMYSCEYFTALRLSLGAAILLTLLTSLLQGRELNWKAIDTSSR